MSYTEERSIIPPIEILLRHTIVASLPAPRELRYRCVCLFRLPDQSDTQYLDTLSPTWFLNRLSRYKRERRYIRREKPGERGREREREPCPASPASFLSYSVPATYLPARSLIRSLVPRPLVSRSLLAYHLNNANDWMVWVLKSRDNLYYNYNEVLYICAWSTGVGGHPTAEVFTRLCLPRLTVSPVSL